MKKLRIQFWKAEQVLAMQILEQEGLPRYKEEGFTRIWDQPALYENSIDLRGRENGRDCEIVPRRGGVRAFRQSFRRKGFLSRRANARTCGTFPQEVRRQWMGMLGGK